MPERAVTVADLAELVRAKNAGPFWVTVDVFARDAAAYRRLADGGAVTREAVARLYGVAADAVRVFWLDDLRAVKVSFPRAVSQGSLADRDVHAGQQHVPLALLRVA